jgi:serine/threonine protein kinase
MAEIYLARKADRLPGHSQPLVLKRMHPHLGEDDQFVKMFLDEAVIVGHLEHENIVRLLDFGRDEEGRYYLALEYVAGTNLEALSRNARKNGRTVPIPIAARICADVCGALSYAHRRTDPHSGRPLGIVHRDVSPSNILLSGQGLVKLADFGIAKARGNLARTASGVLRGKYQYMAPEQARSQQVDGRVDLFALGAVLYKITAGWQPFERDGEVATLRAVAHEEPPPPTAVIAGYPPDLEAVVFRALQKDPGRRFQTADEMGEALEAFLENVDEPHEREDVAALVRSLSEPEAEIPAAPSRPGTPISTSGIHRPNGRRRITYDEEATALADRETPLIGRAEELGTLRQAFQACVEAGRSQLLWLVGPVGIGKSRLVHELCNLVQRIEPGVRIGAGRASPGHGADALKQALLELAGARKEPDEANRRLGWERFVVGLLSGSRAAASENALQIASLVGGLVGLDDEEPSEIRRFVGQPPDEREPAMHALRGILANLAQRKPVLVILDDLHAADPNLIDLLVELAPPLPGPVLFLAISRPELLGLRPELAGMGTRLEVGPLSDASTRALVTQLMGDRAPRALVSAISERAGGNPLLAEEIVRALANE